MVCMCVDGDRNSETKPLSQQSLELRAPCYPRDPPQASQQGPLCSHRPWMKAKLCQAAPCMDTPRRFGAWRMDGCQECHLSSRIFWFQDKEAPKHVLEVALQTRTRCSHACGDIQPHQQLWFWIPDSLDFWGKEMAVEFLHLSIFVLTFFCLHAHAQEAEMLRVEERRKQEHQLSLQSLLLVRTKRHTGRSDGAPLR